MRSFDSDSNWTIRLGEVEIHDQQATYSLVVGYVEDTYKYITDTSIYIRLYDSNDKLIFGRWLNTLEIGYTTDAASELFVLSAELYEKIKKYTERMEALKVFA